MCRSSRGAQRWDPRSERGWAFCQQPFHLYSSFDCLAQLRQKSLSPLPSPPDKRQRRQQQKAAPAAAAGNGAQQHALSTAAAAVQPGQVASAFEVALYAGPTLDSPMLDAAAVSNADAWQHGRVLRVGTECYQVRGA